MKSKLLFCALCTFFIASNLFSQIEKGHFKVSPTFSFSKITEEIDGFTDKFHTRRFDSSGSFGYFPIDNFEFGLSFTTGNTKTEVNESEQSQVNNFFGGYVSYHVPISNNFFIPIQAGAGMNFITIDDNINSPTELSGFGYGAGVGIENLHSKTISSFIMLGFNNVVLEDDDSTFELDNTSTTVRIGFSVFFSSNKTQ